MRIMKFFNLFLPIFLAANLAGCKDDNAEQWVITPFFLDKTNYEVMMNDEISIPVTNGSLDLEIINNNNSLADVSYSVTDPNTTRAQGTIRISGKERGELTLIVKDNTTKELETLNIKVTSKYLGCSIINSNYPLLSTSTTLFLVNDTARTFYVFHNDNINNTTIPKPFCVGTYKFTLEKSAEDYLPFLTLSYNSDSNGMPIDNVEETSCYKFCIINSSSNIYEIFQFFLDINWSGLKDNYSPISKSQPIFHPLLDMVEINKGFYTSGYIKMIPFPENILK